MNELINRPIYLEQLIQHKDKDLIKIQFKFICADPA